MLTIATTNHDVINIWRISTVDPTALPERLFHYHSDDFLKFSSIIEGTIPSDERFPPVYPVYRVRNSWFGVAYNAHVLIVNCMDPSQVIRTELLFSDAIQIEFSETHVLCVAKDGYAILDLKALQNNLPLNVNKIPSEHSIRLATFHEDWILLNYDNPYREEESLIFGIVVNWHTGEC